MIFTGGVVTGFLLAVLLAFIISNAREKNSDSISEVRTEKESENGQMDGVTLFKEPGDIIDESSFKVLQVVAQDAALVNGMSSRSDLYLGTVYLLTNTNDEYYYDDQIVNVEIGQVARQIGIYQYPTKNGFVKTVPIIEIVKK